MGALEAFDSLASRIPGVRDIPPEQRKWLALGVAGLILAVAVAYLMLQPAPAKPKPLTVTVLSAAGERIAGALVKVSGPEYAAEKTTDSEGTAVFEDAPLDASLTVAVEKTGFTPEEKTIRYKPGRERVTVELAAIPEAKAPPQPWREIKLELASEPEGPTMFLPPTEEDAVALAVEAEEKSKPEKARGNVMVRVEDKKTKEALTANVTLHLSQGDEEINSGVAARGTAYFADVPAHVKVYATATAAGYYTGGGKKSARRVKPESEGDTEIAVQLEKIPSGANYSTVLAVDSAGKPVENATVVICLAEPLAGAPGKWYTTSCPQVLSTDENGSASTILKPGEKFYAIVKKASKATNYSSVLPSGSKETVVLTSPNRVDLAVKVLEEVNKTAVANASVSAKLEDGRNADYPVVKTDKSGGAKLLNLQKGLHVEALATALEGKLSGTNSTTLDSKSLTIIARWPPGLLRMCALNMFTKPPLGLGNANLTAYQGAKQVGSCITKADGCCNLTVPAFYATRVWGEAAGMFCAPSTASVDANEIAATNVECYAEGALYCPREECGVSPTFTPPDPIPDVGIDLLTLKVKNAKNKEFDVTKDKLHLGEVYTIEVSVTTKNAHSTGLYLRVGDENTADQDAAAIFRVDDAAAICVDDDAMKNIGIKDLVYSIRASKKKPPHPLGDVNFTSFDALSRPSQLYKWIEMEFDTKQCEGRWVIVVPFKVFINPFKIKAAGEKISFYYRAFAKWSDGTKSYVKRVPFDENYNYTLAQPAQTG